MRALLHVVNLDEPNSGAPALPSQYRREGNKLSGVPGSKRLQQG